MVSSTEMQMGDESAKYVEISEDLKREFGRWETVMGTEKFDTVTHAYRDQYRYVQITQKNVVGPDGVEKPLIVEKADGTVQRTILYERFWGIEGTKWGERETFVDSDGEVTVRFKIVDEKDRVLQIYTKGKNESFYQETSCGLEQIIEDPANSLVEGAERFVADARKLGLPVGHCNFKEKLTGEITKGGIEVNRRIETTFELNYNDREYYKKIISYDVKYVLPNPGENKAGGHDVPPMKEGK